VGWFDRANLGRCTQNHCVGDYIYWRHAAFLGNLVQPARADRERCHDRTCGHIVELELASRRRKCVLDLRACWARKQEGTIEQLPPLRVFVQVCARANEYVAAKGLINQEVSSKFSDIHCGMRGITRDALVQMDLQSQSWEYASEMVLKSVHMNLATAEVPVRFLADREGRLSHHKRAGWFSPWQAAWINLRAMFIYGSDFFVLKPGIVLALVGLVITLAVSFGNLTIGAITLSLNWQFLAVGVFVVGLQAFFLGVIAQVLFDFTGTRTKRWLRVFPYTRTVLTAASLVVLGIALAVPLAVVYLGNDLALTSANLLQDHLAVTGVAAGVAGAELFVFVLLLHGAVVATAHGRPRLYD